MHLNSLIPLIKIKGIEQNPEIFQQQINVIFHNHEAKNYDKIHKEMWESLPLQYELLIKDLNLNLENIKALNLLDIGCGTGLSGELLLRTKLGPLISNITLLDTSSEMLRKASKRLKSWKKNIKIIEGNINKLEEKFDIILISSVLHHIPDYQGFLKEISALQNQNGILIIIHDPLKDSMDHEIYQTRCKNYISYLKQHPKRRNIITKVIEKIGRILQRKSYIDDINKELLERNIISEPLSEPELWSVTDIHVEGLPYSANMGISKLKVEAALPQYQLLSFRTYGFYGSLYSNLQGKFKRSELDLIQSKDKMGRNLSSAWRKISP